MGMFGCLLYGNWQEMFGMGKWSAKRPKRQKLENKRLQVNGCREKCEIVLPAIEQKLDCVERE